jgi:hypothetical protein
MNFLRNISELCIISCYGEISWPARLSDLSVCVLFLLGFVESDVVRNTCGRKHNLKQEISEEINSIPPAMLFHEMDFLKNVSVLQYRWISVGCNF